MSKVTSIVSVIVPCFNYGHLLAETLSSVVNQTYVHWECIIVDDGSSDTTPEIAADFCARDHRFKYIKQENKGLAGARNAGLRNIAGDYVQFLDADDILPIRKLEVHVKVLDDRPDIDLAYGSVCIFDKDISKLAEARQLIMAQPRSGAGFEIAENLLYDNMFLPHCALFRSSIVAEIGMFEESMITCEDWNFWFRIAVQGKSFIFVDNNEALVFARSHGANMSSNRKNMWKGRIHFYKLAASILKKLPGDSSSRKYLIAKNISLSLRFQSRFELTYGNVMIGLWLVAKSMPNGSFRMADLRDTMYWLRQRIFNRL